MVNFSNSVVTLLISGLFCSASFAAEFSLSSPDLQPGQAIKSEQYWNSFGCQGSNVRPQLKWQNAPKKAKSFAVTVYDNDAPTGSGFWHWVVHDIPLTSNSLSSTTLPKGAIEGNTDMGKPGYLGLSLDHISCCCCCACMNRAPSSCWLSENQPFHKASQPTTPVCLLLCHPPNLASA